MIAIHSKKAINVQLSLLKEIDKQYLLAINNLKDLCNLTHDVDDRDYVGKIYKLFTDTPKILIADTQTLETYKNEIGEVPKKSVIRTRKGKQYTANVKSGIQKKIILALGYETYRDEFYPRYFKMLDIRSCVYCNSQLTLTIRNPKKNIAKFDVDHFNPKSEFPWMSISLFNLYPSCVPCNRSKSSSPVEFKLFSNDKNEITQSKFKFRLDPSSKARYLLTKDYRDINYFFEEPPISIGYKGHDGVFSISTIYQTQRDIAEELIIWSQIYDAVNRKTLSENFTKLGLSPDIFKRVILGSYTSERDIHRRPMSKFIQDISKDLGLL